MSKFGKLLVSVMLVGLVGSALAGDETKRVMAIEVVGDDAGDATSFFFDSEDLGFDLDEMQVGETRSIIDESGQSVLITRNEDGFSFNIDGKEIELPDFADAEHNGIHWVSDSDATDVNVHVMRNVGTTSMKDMGGTVILSSEPIDAATQQAIKSVLESAGYDSDVDFIDHDSEHDGQVMIKKVEKVVESPQT